MKTIFYTIFSMSLSGSIAYFLFQLTAKITKLYFSASWHYKVLKSIILLFLVPISLLVPYFLKLSALFSSSAAVGVTLSVYKTDSYFNLFQQFMQKLFANDSLLKILSAFWLTGAVLFLLWQIICYIRFYQSIHTAVPMDTAQTGPLLEKNQTKKEIQLFLHNKISTPMLVGIKNPIILIPQNFASQQDMDYIIKHELLHFKRHDLWIKISFLFVMALHWFNPVVYHLCQRLDQWCEYSCDEAIAANLNQEQRKQYGMALLNAISAMHNTTIIFGTTFVSSKTNLERRLHIMLNSKKSTKLNKIISLSLACAMLTCGTVTALGAQTKTGSFTIKEKPHSETISAAPSAAVSTDISEFEPGTKIPSSTIQPFITITPATKSIPAIKIDSSTMRETEFTQDGLTFTIVPFTPAK